MKNYLKLTLIAIFLFTLSHAFADIWVACSAGYKNFPFYLSVYTGCGKGSSAQAAINKAKAACDSKHCEEAKAINGGCAAAVAGGNWYIPYQGVGVVKNLTIAKNNAYDDAQQVTREDEATLCSSSQQTLVSRHHTIVKVR